MKRLVLAVATLAMLAAIPMMSGCAGGAATPGVNEVIPGVPFPAFYRVLVTPEGADEPIATVHRLGITAPAVGTNHDFEFTLQPSSDLTPLGTLEVMTARSPGSPPVRKGQTVTVEVNATEMASPAHFRGVTGYEASGPVIAMDGVVTATFVTNADGTKSVNGTFELATEAGQVPPQLRQYKGTFTGDLIVDAEDDPGTGDGGGTGPPQPPF
jgi:hypothetical protein